MLSFNSLGLLGRLGNQMFQYAALFALARRAGTEHCIPPSSGLASERAHQLRHAFKLPGLRHLGRQAGVPMIRERSFNYDAALHRNCPKDADLFGYFQSEKYFAELAAEIRSEFQFHEPVAQACAAKLARCRRPVVSLHVRRGDYLALPHMHPPCSLAYYERAIAAFPPDWTILVFSDDIAWCMAQPIFRGSRFAFSRGSTNIGDLGMMSLCDHHIIANSSFSWWGAWLGRNAEKTIVAPRRWFGDHGPTAAHDTADLIPPGWVVM